MFVAPPRVSFSVPTDFQTMFQLASSQTDYKTKACRRWTHSRASLLNFTHNLSPSKTVSKTLKQNMIVHADGRKHVQLQQTNFKLVMWNCSALFFKRQQDTKHTAMQHQSETQSSSWLADLPPGCCHKQSVSGCTVQRVRNSPLVTTCQEGGGKQRLRLRNWGKGQAWMLQLLLWNWTWMSCTGTAVFQRFRVSSMTKRLQLWSQCTYTSAVQSWLQFTLNLILKTYHACCCWVSSHRGGCRVELKMRTLQNYHVISFSHVLGFNWKG